MPRKKADPEYQKRWYEENKERVRELRKKRYEENKEIIKESITEEERLRKIEYLREYRVKNKDVISEKKRAKYIEDIDAIKARGAEWRDKNRDYLREKALKYYHDNRDVIAPKKMEKYYAIKDSGGKTGQRKWYDDNKDTPEFKSKEFIRHSIGNIIRCAKVYTGSAPYVYKSVSDDSIEKTVGCSLVDLIKHIESKFSDGMTWKNHGKWHVDHIFPISKCVELYGAEESVSLVNHYSNLQPLWAKENLEKRDKI